MSVRYQKVWMWVQIVCLVFLTCLFLRKGVLPGWHALNTDFPNYYLVARLLREGYNLDRIYDWVWLQRIKDHWGIDQPLVGFAGLTPFSALPIFPMAGFAVLTAKQIWIIANLLFLVGTAEALHSVTSLHRRCIWLLSLLAIFPLRYSFMFGQMHVAVLILLTLAYFLHCKEKRILSGICVALAGALKVYPLLFAFYFVWKRQWREALSVIGATIALLSICYLCFGSHVMHIYITQILPRSMQGEVTDPYSPRAASAAAFFHRLFLLEPDMNPATVWNRPVLYSIFYPLWQAAMLLIMFLSIRPRSDQETEKLEWAAFLVLLLALSPVPSSYHFVVLILPAVLAADVFVKRKQHGRLAILVLLYYLVCGELITISKVGPSFSPLMMLAFSRLWFCLLLWLFLLFCLWRQNRLTEPHKDLGLHMMQLIPVLAIFWIIGFISYQRHFVHRKDDLRARVPLHAHQYLATGVHPRADGFIATTMVGTGYRIADQSGNAVWPVDKADQLSSAATRSGSRIAIEMADENGSRITLNDASAQIPSGEYPALSPDGSSLAYIRETKGRGSLWLATLTPTAGTTTEVVGPPYDVRDAAFATSGAIIFTARINGSTNIYQITPGGPLAVLVDDKEEVESAAASPDGQWLVFRKLLHDRWQLMVMDLASRQERQLTFSDCHASAPAWMDDSTIIYSTDCERGLGLTALASISVGR
jgi:hypothetical protein